jgi:hypothetical protein
MKLKESISKENASWISKFKRDDSERMKLRSSAANWDNGQVTRKRVGRFFSRAVSGGDEVVH